MRIWGSAVSQVSLDPVLDVGVQLSVGPLVPRSLTLLRLTLEPHRFGTPERS